MVISFLLFLSLFFFSATLSFSLAFFSFFLSWRIREALNPSSLIHEEEGRFFVFLIIRVSNGVVDYFCLLADGVMWTVEIAAWECRAWPPLSNTVRCPRRSSWRPLTRRVIHASWIPLRIAHSLLSTHLETVSSAVHLLSQTFLPPKQNQNFNSIPYSSNYT